MAGVVLGLRGAGKSTAGAAAAARLGREFVDLDDVTRERLGAATVREAWERFGEVAFRAAELAGLAGVLGCGGDPVVALGGGTGMIEGFEGVTSGARRVYLHAPAAALAARLREGDADRPALLGESAVEEVGAVYAARDGVYRRLAHAVVEAGGTFEETVEGLAAALRGQAARA